MRRSKKLGGYTLRPVSDNAWISDALSVHRMDWEKPDQRWYAIWTDFFNVKHTLKRPTWGALKAAVEAGETI